MVYLAIVLGIVVAVAAIALVRARAMQTATPVDPFTLGEPWRHHVAAALSTQRRYEALVRTVHQGPLRERLERVAAQVHRAVEECSTVARRGDQFDATIRSIDGQGLRARRLRANDEEIIASLDQQLASLDRIRSTRDETDRQLHRLQTRLGELVSEAAVVVSQSQDMSAIATDLGSGIDDVVIQLRALHLAVDELPGAGGPVPPQA